MASDLLESLADCHPSSSLAAERFRTRVAQSPAVAELRRFQLSLLIAFEEGSLEVASELIRNAALGESLYFAARQTFDDARHLEAFRFQLGAGAEREAELVSATPLRDYFAQCRDFAARGADLEALTLLNLAFKSMAGAFYTWTARYWEPIDVPLARLVRRVATEEAVHGLRAGQLVRGGSGDPSRRADLLHLAEQSRQTLQDAFRSYIDTFVSRFGVIVRLHADRFRTAEFAHGRRLLQISEDEQAAFILARCAEALAAMRAKAGLHGDR